MKKLILYPLIASLVPVFSNAALKCDNVFSGSQSTAIRSSSATAHAKVLKVLELLTANNFTGAYKVSANMVTTLRSSAMGKEKGDDSLVSNLNPAEQALLVTAFENNYADISLNFHVKIMELFDNGKFEISEESLNLWVDTYISKLGSAEKQTHATHLAIPMRAIELMGKNVPEKLIKAVEARIIATQGTLEYSLANVAQILRVFAWYQANPSSHFMTIMDTQLRTALEVTLQDYKLNNTLQEVLIISAMKSLDFLNHDPSDAVIDVWYAIKDAIQNKIELSPGESKLKSDFYSTLTYIGKADGRRLEAENEDLPEYEGNWNFEGEDW